MWKNSKWKKSQFWTFERNQNQRTTSFNYFENLKELMGFNERTGKMLIVFYAVIWLVSKKWKLWTIYWNRVFDCSITMIIYQNRNILNFKENHGYHIAILNTINPLGVCYNSASPRLASHNNLTTWCHALDIKELSRLVWSEATHWAS
jgi:hypothetical protein